MGDIPLSKALPGSDWAGTPVEGRAPFSDAADL